MLFENIRSRRDRPSKVGRSSERSVESILHSKASDQEGNKWLTCPKDRSRIDTRAALCTHSLIVYCDIFVHGDCC